MREAVAAKLTRGKIDCRVSYAATIASQAPIPDVSALASLAETQAGILAVFPQARPLTVWEVLHAPGITADQSLIAENVKEPLFSMLSTALVDLDATRAREGMKLAALIIERLDRIEQLVHMVTPLIPQLVDAYQQKLATKLEEAMAATDERLRQEVILFASRIDVAEELNRLSAHISEVRRVLTAGGSAGKRLDFLMQELNREANTLGSKSAATEVTNVSVELKVLIEQMREQIQNIE